MIHTKKFILSLLMGLSVLGANTAIAQDRKSVV